MWARAFTLCACGPECEFPAALGKVGHGWPPITPALGSRDREIMRTLPGQPPYLKVVMERVVEENSLPLL